MKPLTSVLICLVSLLAFGCASIGDASSTYQEPTPENIPNEVVFEMPFEEAWDVLVRELATRFYVINNIDKESRLINVSFSSDTPEQFVTGGQTTRQLDRGGEISTWTYDPAASSSYEIEQAWGDFNNLPMTATVIRRTSLEGRSNIYVAPAGGSTRLTVNCRYILTVEVSGTFVGKNAFGGVAQAGTVPPKKVSAAFNTNEPCSVNWGTPGEPDYVAFRSTGEFEKDVISILKN